MKRIFWTVGMAVAGFFLAWKAQGATLDLKELLLITAWVGCVGYGFGSIFEGRFSGRRLVVYWAVTIAMVSPLFSPALPFSSNSLRLTVAAAIGALIGTLLGMVQVKLARRKPSLSGSENAS
jgi:hypothetical protein